TTIVSPAQGGTVSGGGTFNSGSNVTVVATPNANFTFANWTEFGSPVSSQATYSFTATANRRLTANFALSGQSRVFDFAKPPIPPSLPIDLPVGGLTGHFSATGAGYSIQPANTMGFTPAGFAGLCIYPNSVFAADLQVDFSSPVTDCSIMYAP